MRLVLDPLSGMPALAPDRPRTVVISNGGIVPQTSGGGGGTANISARQTVTPAPNGVATTFTTPANYASGSLTVFLNGIAESHIIEVTPSTFSFATAPLTGDEIVVSYAT